MPDGTVVRGGILLPKWAMPVLLVFVLGVFATLFNEREARIARDAAREVQDKQTESKLNEITTLLKLNREDNKDITNNYNQILGYLESASGKSIRLKPLTTTNAPSPPREDQ